MAIISQGGKWLKWCVFVGALAKIGQGEIDYQWFKCAILLIVRRCMHDVCKEYARWCMFYNIKKNLVE